MKKQKISAIVSTRRPEYASYSDDDIQRMYAKADDERKALMLAYDDGKATDADIDTLDHKIFALDDELCARGF